MPVNINKRRGGQLKDLIKISEDFDAPLPENILKQFYEDENDIFANKIAFKKIQQGLDDAANNRVSKIGSFAKYLKDEKD